VATKSGADRWAQTINYLNAHFPTLGTHIDTTVPPGVPRYTIAEELSLEFKTGQRFAGPHLSSAGKRNALRGLLLCQRVYFSPLWAKKTTNRVEYGPDEYSLAQDWKTQSLNHWHLKSEAQIRQGIAMFMPVEGATAADVSRVAKLGPPTGRAPEIAGNLTLSRSDTDAPPGSAETCYRGVLAWLLRSGVVSLRWFMRDTAPNGQIACDRMFGTGTEVWPAATHFEDTSVLPAVERGFIAHMWTEQMGIAGWNGHWVVSNGDGTICGVNNGEVARPDERVLNAYTKTGRLRSQFEGYGGYIMTQRMNDRGFLEDVPKEPLEWARAKMVKFDPLNLPNQM
jgi:hypothetical protein